MKTEELSKEKCLSKYDEIRGPDDRYGSASLNQMGKRLSEPEGLKDPKG